MTASKQSDCNRRTVWVLTFSCRIEQSNYAPPVPIDSTIHFYNRARAARPAIPAKPAAATDAAAPVVDAAAAPPSVVVAALSESLALDEDGDDCGELAPDMFDRDHRSILRSL